CDMIYFHRLIEVAKQRADWSVLVGPEELTAEAVLLGGHGGINGGANLHPKLYVEMYRAAAAQDLKRTRELHAEVMRLAGSIYTVGRHKSAIIKGIKCGLSLLGICEDHMAEPFHRFRDPEREIIRERLTALGLIP
ncbi:dihydrodipicolinate synthase family protein, partial [Prosthecobacter sp.]|uniref:dihydrodipicolinate synthase family protein n=1 Tax=Prosthecobacter sp. TaxID=1965333 RepID=UPI001D441F1C